MEVRVLRPFWYGGEVKTVGTKLDLPDHLAREVVFGGKAERVIPPPAAKAQPATEPPAIPKQTMTTKSAPALAGKKGD
jgi:hypothetical protein